LSMGWVDPWVGLGQSADHANGLGWIGLQKNEPMDNSGLGLWVRFRGMVWD